jgi:hypothetical protein
MTIMPKGALRLNGPVKAARFMTGLVGEHSCSGVFIDSEIAALAGYEVWGVTIAHISVIMPPAFRRRGFGRSAVAHVIRAVLTAGLVPQYRALQSNRASIRIAE